MAGFLIAILSGALMSIQGVFNTGVTKSSSIWVAAGFVQITAFLTCAVMWIVDGRPQIMGLFNVSPKISLLGGVISQIAVAYIIELFGLFGSEKKDFSWIKLLGIAVAVTGVVIFSMCGNSKE